MGGNPFSKPYDDDYCRQVVMESPSQHNPFIDVKVMSPFKSPLRGMQMDSENSMSAFSPYRAQYSSFVARREGTIGEMGYNKQTGRHLSPHFDACVNN
jgi:hypothetical protein